MIIGPLFGANQIPLQPEDAPVVIPPDYSQPPILFSDHARARRPSSFAPSQRPFDVLDYIETLIVHQHNGHVRRTGERARRQYLR